MQKEVAQKLYIVMLELFYMYDPAGLSDIAPFDEYAPEVGMLLARPEIFEDQERLRAEIYATCAVCFGARNILPVADETYTKLAKEFIFAKEIFQEHDARALCR